MAWPKQKQNTYTRARQGPTVSTENYSPYPMINHNGKEYFHIYIWNHFVVHQKLTQYCKSTIFQLKRDWTGQHNV